MDQMEEALIAAGQDLEDMDEDDYEQLQMALIESMGGNADGDGVQTIEIDDDDNGGSQGAAAYGQNMMANLANQFANIMMQPQGNDEDEKK